MIADAEYVRGMDRLECVLDVLRKGDTAVEVERTLVLERDRPLGKLERFECFDQVWQARLGLSRRLAFPLEGLKGCRVPWIGMSFARRRAGTEDTLVTQEPGHESAEPFRGDVVVHGRAEFLRIRARSLGGPRSLDFPLEIPWSLRQHRGAAR
jgi:hypothetical protein